MDIVFIEGLEVDTVIGAYDWERGVKQCLRIDLQLGWDARLAAESDDLRLALDYVQVCGSVQRFASKADFILVETFAERLAELLLAEFGVLHVRLKLTKPGAVAAAIAVGVEIERGCR